MKTSILKQTLREAGFANALDTRTFNALITGHDYIRTVGDLVQWTESALLRRRNFGRKGLKDVKDHLRALGLYLGMDVDQAELREEPDDILTLKACLVEGKAAHSVCLEAISHAVLLTQEDLFIPLRVSDPAGFMSSTALAWINLRDFLKKTLVGNLGTLVDYEGPMRLCPEANEYAGERFNAYGRIPLADSGMGILRIHVRSAGKVGSQPVTMEESLTLLQPQ